MISDRQIYRYTRDGDNQYIPARIPTLGRLRGRYTSITSLGHAWPWETVGRPQLSVINVAVRHAEGFLVPLE